MEFDARKAVAIADLVEAVDGYKEALMFYDPDCHSYSVIELPQLAVARAFLRLSGLPGGPYEIYTHAPVRTAAPAEEPIASAVRAYRKGTIDSDLRWRVFERDNFTCQECGARRHLHADHVIPESKGGPTAYENLQTLCRDCNLKKGDRV